MKKNSVRKGDMISIPIIDDNFAIAQVIVKKSILYISIFSGLWDSPFLLKEILKGPVILAGWTMDAKIYNGDWQIIDNSPIRYKNYSDKLHLVIYNDNVCVQNFHGDIIRMATDEDKRNLYLKTSYSPARFEKIIRAFNKIEPWLPDYDDLLVNADFNK